MGREDKVVETAILLWINTGIAHRQAGGGQIGAGVVQAPLARFVQALEAFATAYLSRCARRLDQGSAVIQAPVLHRPRSYSHLQHRGCCSAATALKVTKKYNKG